MCLFILGENVLQGEQIAGAAEEAVVQAVAEVVGDAAPQGISFLNTKLTAVCRHDKLWKAI